MWWSLNTKMVPITEGTNQRWETKGADRLFQVGAKSRKESINSVHLVYLGEILGYHHAMIGGDQLQIWCFSVTSSDFQNTGVAETLLMAHDTI